MIEAQIKESLIQRERASIRGIQTRQYDRLDRNQQRAERHLEEDDAIRQRLAGWGKTITKTFNRPCSSPDEFGNTHATTHSTRFFVQITTYPRDRQGNQRFAVRQTTLIRPVFAIRNTKGADSDLTEGFFLGGCFTVKVHPSFEDAIEDFESRQSEDIKRTVWY